MIIYTIVLIKVCSQKGKRKNISNKFRQSSKFQKPFCTELIMDGSKRYSNTLKLINSYPRDF